MINQSQQTEEPLQRQSQFKWPRQAGAMNCAPTFPPQQATWPRLPDTDRPSPRQFQWSPVQSQPVTMPPPQFQPLPLPPQEIKPLSKKQKQIKVGRKSPRPRRKKLRRVLVIISILTIMSTVLCTQANGQFGAQLADVMRAVLGPTVTAQIESFFLGVSDTVHQVQYQVGGQHVDPPWTVSRTYKPGSSGGSQVTMPLVPLKPFISPPLSGEGAWVTDGLPPSTNNLPPLVAKTFIRPDPARPYAIVTLLQFDTRFLALHMVAGTYEPGGPRGIDGPGKIPAGDLKTLFAAFNGGFKYADGQYGMDVNGTIYVPPQNGAATIAVTKEGQVILGAWGKDPRLNSGNTDLASWRQNASLLIDNNVVSSLANDGAAWGGTILNQAYTWRSGIGLTSSGSLIYAAGDSLSALTLGRALQAAGAVMAMQTDINPFWVRAFLYNRDASGSLQITKLNPGMQGSGNEYLYGTERDFFYITRILPNGAH